MRTFSEYNPAAVAVYFLAVIGIAMFCLDPILLFLSLLGGIFYQIARKSARPLKTHAYFLLLFLLSVLVNPIFSHNGVTVLFVVNDSPITLEATVYGAVAGLMILAVLYWFRAFTQIFTSDKLLYLFSRLSPKLALILSMGLRYVPLFGEQARRIRETQTALGLYKDGNVVDRFRGGVRVFSVMVTWSLENGIITADSMTARGYGLERRTHFSIFRFRRGDWLLLGTTITLTAVCLTALALNPTPFTCYPAILWPPLSPLTAAAYGSYGLLAFLPTILEAKEALKWRSLLSKI